MAPDRYTELFFLDEATGLAAGHRPCFECRRRSYLAYAETWAIENASLLGAGRPTASLIDEEQRRVMKEIVKWRLDGRSWDEIRQHIVYGLKLVTKDGKAWNHSRIIRAFQAELRLQAIENGGSEE
jgi:hypothetical protein